MCFYFFEGFEEVTEFRFFYLYSGDCIGWFLRGFLVSIFCEFRNLDVDRIGVRLKIFIWIFGRLRWDVGSFVCLMLFERGFFLEFYICVFGELKSFYFFFF